MSQNGHVQRNRWNSQKCIFLLPVNITSEAPINFSEINANPFSLDSKDKNKARPENYHVMATEFDTDLTSRDVISADVITEVNQVDDVVMSSGEKGDTYDGVSGVSDRLQ